MLQWGLRDNQQGKKFDIVEKKLKNFADSTKEIVVFSASRTNQESIESSNYHGYFTYFLLKAFDGDADADNNGLVTFRELFNYVNTNVRSISNNTQIPVMFGNFKPDANFFRVPIKN